MVALSDEDLLALLDATSQPGDDYSEIRRRLEKTLLAGASRADRETIEAALSRVMVTRALRDNRMRTTDT